MDRIDNIKLKKLYLKLSKEYNLTVDEIKNIVGSPYEFTSEKVKEYNFTDIEEEDFNKLKKVFLYKGLGKIYISYMLIERRKKLSLNIIKLNNKKWKK
jgi:hypothetical protein